MLDSKTLCCQQVANTSSWPGLNSSALNFESVQHVSHHPCLPASTFPHNLWSHIVCNYTRVSGKPSSARVNLLRWILRARWNPDRHCQNPMKICQTAWRRWLDWLVSQLLQHARYNIWHQTGTLWLLTGQTGLLQYQRQESGCTSEPQNISMHMKSFISHFEPFYTLHVLIHYLNNDIWWRDFHLHPGSNLSQCCLHCDWISVGGLLKPILFPCSVDKTLVSAVLILTAFLLKISMCLYFIQVKFSIVFWVSGTPPCFVVTLAFWCAWICSCV